MFASSGLLDKPAEKKKPAEEKLLTAHDKATIMIMGVDERADDVGRSDTLMVATIDPEDNHAALLSIPRDTRVKIQGHGYDKINSAYAYGGERLTERTVENFLGVNIDHFVIINTKAFTKIIDAIDGVDINVEKRMYYEDPWDDDGGLIIDLRPGMQHMDGKTAVTYVRYRDEEGDIGRVRRQQKFMRACIDKITSPAIIPKLPAIVSDVTEAVRTDLSVRQVIEFIGTLKAAHENGLEAEMVPGRPLYIDGVSYWIPDVNKLRMALADTLGVTLSRTMMNDLEKEAREYENSIPADAKEVPPDDKSIGRAVTDGRSSAWQKETKRDDKERKTVERQKDDQTTVAPTNRNTEPAVEQRAPRTADDAYNEARGNTPATNSQPAAPPSIERPSDRLNETDSAPPSPSMTEGKTQ